MQDVQAKAARFARKDRIAPLALSNPDHDPARLVELMKINEPRKTFCIFFTPRSGSTWLFDTIAQTNALGRPQEWFNPKFLPKALRLHDAPDLDSYVAVVRRKQKRGGVFSFEITHNQILRVFGSEDRFLQFFPATTPAFWLIREDIVQQAISLAKAAKTAVFHSPQASAEAISAADAAYRYDPDEIAFRIETILEQEENSEAFFARNAIVPHRLSYEGNIRAGAEAISRQFLRIIRPEDADSIELPAFVDKYQKIGSSKNLDFAERFSKERPDVIAKVEKLRARHLDNRPQD